MQLMHYIFLHSWKVAEVSKNCQQSDVIIGYKAMSADVIIGYKQSWVQLLLIHILCEL